MLQIKYLKNVIKLTYLLKTIEKYSTQAHVDKNNIYFKFNPCCFKNVTKNANFLLASHIV